jgi:bifunctional NMN adenylyltransferase/nudix hydrolase
MHNFGVFVGRFQPFHTAHLDTLRFALRKVEQLIIVVGSDNRARTVKDPWSSAERIAMIRSCLSNEERLRVAFVSAKDYLYNDNMWIAEIQRAVKALVGSSKDVVLIGHKKDASSFYLNLFPQWEFIDSEVVAPNVGATKVRELMFSLDKIGVRACLPPNVFALIQEFMETDEFKRLYEEHHHIQNYRAQWADAPFPPTFNTVDSVVICSGHVLVVRRRCAPGKGLIALPGGFLNVDERIIDGCLRELKEETGIKVATQELRKLIVDNKVFDHPGRSLRGRTITHAVCINLSRGELPTVKGMDDADKAWWMPLDTVYENESSFFEDHFHIVNYFINRV